MVRALRCVLAVLLALVVAIPVSVAGVYWFEQWRAGEQQEPLDAFYTPPEPISGEPGTVIRSQAAPEWDVAGANATRILYVTRAADGTARVSGGMVWIPVGDAARQRKVVAWAHGTVGLGDQCAPSRNPAIMQTMSVWITQMVRRGWIVTATDYQGLGTPPPYTYLVGAAEAHDVVNSVRAARNLPGAAAGKEWVSYGFSQGGHSAVWAAHSASDLAPELSLQAVVAVSPAVPLAAVLDQQWDTGVAWAIGPEVMVSWPSWRPELQTSAIVSEIGQDVTDSQALDCVTTAGLIGLGRQDLGQRYFTVNPMSEPQWSQAFSEQTPAPLPRSLPVFVPVGTKDNVVLPTSIAYMQRQWCRAGSDLTMDWLGGVDHLSANTVAAPAIVNWIGDRFAGRPTDRNCGEPPPVAPYRPGP